MNPNNDIETVRQYYNSNPEQEWYRLEEHPFEFAITQHYLDRYLKPGSRVLDIGGGPGRYALYLSQKGCDVTLLDLSEGNVTFAKEKAKQFGLPLTALAGDARVVHQTVNGLFDAVLLMGPLYHLLEKEDRESAVYNALRLLKPGGILFASFISINGGICFAMKNLPEALLDPDEAEPIQCYVENRMFCGNGFTKACMFAPKEVLPFFASFPLEKLHLLGQESILAPCEDQLVACSQEVVDAWVKLGIQVCEREDLLSFSEHILYIGKKTI